MSGDFWFKKKPSLETKNAPDSLSRFLRKK